ncbi:MAG: hypothetical protein AAF937_04090 [Planctomycetota bacterium]
MAQLTNTPSESTPIVRVALGSGSGRDDSTVEAHNFEAAIAGFAVSLRGVLRDCTPNPGGGVPNEAELVAQLKLDRSVIGKVIRSLRCRSADEFLHEIPSPDGLRLIVGAAARAGSVTPGRASSMRAEIDRFGAFVSAYPGKRRAFLLRLASQLPKRREAADLAARRSMTRAAAELLGFRVRTAVATMVVFDGDDPDRFDTIHAFGKHGLERTRDDGPPIIAGSLRTGPQGPRRDYAPADPARDPLDPASSLMRSYCRGPAHVEFIRTTSGLTELQIPASEPAIHQPIDVVCAQRAPGVLLRHRRAEFSHEWHQVVTRMPTETGVIDLVFAPGVYERASPLVSQHLYRPDAPRLPKPGMRRADEIRPYVSVEELGLGPEAAHLDGVEGYESCLRELLAFTGQRPDSFRVVRIIKQYPELGTAITCWMQLPAADGAAEDG